MKTYDLAVLGGGPAGCAAALMATSFRQRVALIERNRLGGLNLHQGGIPMKSLLVNARNARRTAKEGLQDPKGLLSDFITRQRNVVNRTYQELQIELENAGVAVLKGNGRLVDKNQLVVSNNGNEELIEARKIIVATGSITSSQTGITADGQRILDSQHIFSLIESPSQLIIIGGGYIGCEYASIFSSLGANVTIVEQQSRLLPYMDPTAGKFLHLMFNQQNINVLTESQVITISNTSNAVEVKLADGRILQSEYAILAHGRTPLKEEIGLPTTLFNSNGFVEVDNRMETRQPHLFVVGDANGISSFAHSAILQGRIAALNAMGDDFRFQPHFVPTCIYSFPEIAAVGWQEEQATETGYDVVCAQCPFTRVGRAVAMGELAGFVKLIADRRSQKLLGGIIAGGQAAEMIGQITMALHMGATVPQLMQCTVAHPTLSEAIQEAAWNLLLKMK